MKPRYALAASLLLLAGGCSTSPRSQERVRENTANATAAIASSAKSAVLGIRDGLARKPSETGVNINTANRADLEALPGVTPAMARNIIANRPYKNPNELRKHKILPKDVFDRNAGRLTVVH